MRRIIVVGAGQAGLQLALALQQHGYDVTVATERTPEEIRGGRVLSNQCMFAPALRHERELGLNFWDEETPWVTGIAFAAAGAPGARAPAIAWRSALDHKAQSVDQRLKMSFWLEEFARRGGAVQVRRVGPADLEEYARTFELVLVAAGRGPLAGLFARDDERSPYREPQRVICLVCVVPDGPGPLGVYPGVTFGLAPGVGEYFALPVLSARGPMYGMYFSGLPGGPLDCWGRLEGPEAFFEQARTIVRTYLPWEAEAIENKRVASPHDTLLGRVTPTVRHAVGRLPSGARVLAMGDTAVTNDPIAGQGSNLASHCSAAYLQAIVEHGDRPYDEAFMQTCFDRFWGHARHATRFSNDLLAPPPPHVLETLTTAQSVPEVAHRFAELFNDPSDYGAWLTDRDRTAQYLREAKARATA
ncbi:MAG TPA: styrene monooxygenase/indole monooxygenase family protein [Polyangiaceae bacterium]|nr:styrene monooxygenase/indole monooxygenase family protein [Polyangiaceae bacterium]